ncbi:efflux RND transporter periplasmic adaptor subunit [Sphingobacterium sp. lm-10]|uniref:efflux RND transporter periplasmic adaptor subunit n=1 Tax=Sphingobacterium sp. lm-10 TaxID=2944904 RepID=UPI002021BC8B|nr:efflux RND transporter periplasmic adaptor subunit [Sphingobacterium sp. lm-10]MCL7986492.1 efflux RND transporter periplasmic adaptor subunit [Sphingobacterium sp. lm-10]
MMKAAYTALFLIGTTALWSCGHAQREVAIPVEDTIPVTLLSLRQLDADEIIEATGVFTTDDETVLGFKNGGVIQQIYVKEGDPVRKGQRLASVQATEIDTRAGQVNVGLEKAERDYQRAQKLYRDSVATLEQLQNARSAWELAKRDVDAVQYNQQQLHIISPVSGFVLARLANQGQVVGPGTPVLQVNGAGMHSWMLKVGVSDSQWAKIQKGDAAEIETDALPGQKLQAIVSKKLEAMDPQSGTFTIYLDLKTPPSGKLATGVFGKSRISVGKAANNTSPQASWELPYEALVDADGNQAYVFVTRDGKRATKQAVKLGSIGQQSVMVLSGLENIDGVIVAGSPYLTEGSLIRVKP